MFTQEVHMFQLKEPKTNNQILTKKSGNTGKNINSKPGTIYNIRYIGITKYDKRIHR